jgi:hypothetical protein
MPLISLAAAPGRTGASTPCLSPIPDVHRALAAALGAIRDSRRLAKLMFDTPTFDLLASAYLSRSPPEFKWDLDRFRRAFRKDVGDR